MNLEDLKFTEEELADKGVSNLPNKVVGQASWLKQKFDEIGKNQIALGRFNQLIDALEEKFNELSGELNTDYFKYSTRQAHGTLVNNVSINTPTAYEQYKLSWNSIYRDTDFYGMTLSEVIIKQSGYYLISLRGYFTNNTVFSIGAKVNGNVICNGAPQKLLSWGYSEACAVCKLEPDDQIQTYVSRTDALNINICNVSNRSTLDVIKIGNTN